MALACIKCENLSLTLREYPCKECCCRDNNKDKKAPSHFIQRSEDIHGECTVKKMTNQ